MSRPGRAAVSKPSAKTAPRSISAPSRVRGRARPSDTPVAGKLGHAAVWVAPGDLRPWRKNPRHNDGAVDAIAESITRFGFGAPIVARKATSEVIGGHTRLKAALKLGLELVPVRFLDISERDAQSLALADNRLGELADWDEPALAELLQGMEPEDQLAAGWNARDVDKLLAEVGELPAAPEPDKPERTVRYRCPSCSHEW